MLSYLAGKSIFFFKKSVFIFMVNRHTFVK